ncbi:MAG: hypothetical protein ABFC67_04935 [Mizugakiibacter sp.]|uniref:hypothetical protein n=1 Tax=Mizugakiibacter sp. TaxID=1972610 RepID=UPI00320D2644
MIALIVTLLTLLVGAMILIAFEHDARMRASHENAVLHRKLDQCTADLGTTIANLHELRKITADLHRKACAVRDSYINLVAIVDPRKAGEMRRVVAASETRSLLTRARECHRG